MNFSDWFARIHGFAPFPWQSSVAEDWPAAIAIPTGAGKTAVIDAWLYRRLMGRPAPRRLWYVVDRRVLVDEAYERAKRIVKQTNAKVPVIRLRGGVFDQQELPRLDRTAIFCSTVDQFASRLFFRGYGVGRASLPLHAALAGIDSIVVIDEAHISEPLLQSVAAAVARGARVTLTPMSATLRIAQGKALQLGDDDRRHPELAKRLSARKLARLATGKLAAHAHALRREGAASIAVWCNTVAEAVSTADQLVKRGEAPVLITGRDRLLERDKVMSEWHPRLKSGVDKSPEVYLVSTQCLEVGVDWDFDAMVTECADIGALRQRFGRLDRLGRRGTSHAVIVKPPSKPPIYGEAALRTWEWLQSIAADGVIDFGVTALPPAPSECVMPPPLAPQLLDAHLDAWSMTSVRSDSIPDVGPWLHGMGQDDNSVGVVWRDLPPDQSKWTSAIQAMPPTEPETASVPIRLVQESAQQGTTLIRWRGADDVAITPSIAPGDVVIVQSGTAGFAPTPTTDVAEEAAEVAGKPRVRVIEPDVIEWREIGGDDPESVAMQKSRLGLCDVLPYPGGVVIARRYATSEQSTKPVCLKEHSEAVAALAEEIASGCDLPVDLVATMKLAGRWHDAGKADPRMQLWLGATGELLAKSGQTNSQMRTGLQASGYPRGQRHELLSVELARDAGVPELATYLISAHHGHARPLVPRQDSTPVDVRIELDGKVAHADAGQVGRGIEDQFWRAQTVHGRWGLALLTAILVDADRRVSAR